MRRFDPTAHRPADDSSVGYSSKAEAESTVFLVVGDGLCGCGCETPVGKKSRFTPGHDQRLKGVLIRAEVAGTPIVLVSPDLGGPSIATSATGYAEMLTDETDWVFYVQSRAATHIEKARRAAEAAEARAAAKALREATKAARKAAKTGAAKTEKEAVKAAKVRVEQVKIGRWTYDAMVREDGTYAVTRKDGSTADAVVGTDGKIRWAA